MKICKTTPEKKSIKYLRDIPFVIGAKQTQNILSDFSKKMISFGKQVHSVAENSNKRQSLKDEIARTDKKIDEEVYKLYGLTEEEIKVVEGKEKE